MSASGLSHDPRVLGLSVATGPLLRGSLLLPLPFSSAHDISLSLSLKQKNNLKKKEEVDGKWGIREIVT